MPTTPEITFANCRVVAGSDLLNRGWLRVREGRIVDFGTDERSGDVDGDGRYLLPGLIDLHCCAFKGLLSPRKTLPLPGYIARQSYEALCLTHGITTVCSTVRLSDLPVWNETNATEATELNALCAEVSDTALVVHHVLHLRCDLSWPDIVRTAVAFCESYRPRIVSFIRCCPGLGRFGDADVFRKYLEERLFGPLPDDVASFSAARNPGDDVLWARARAVVSQLAGQHLLFGIHDPADGSDITRASQCGIRLAEFPITDQCVDAARARGLFVCMGAPNVLQGGSQYGNLSTRSVWERRHLDVLTSDYYPGALLSAVFSLAALRVDVPFPLGLPDAVRCATQVPGRLLRLARKGAIRKGNDADLILVRLDEAAQPRVEMTMIGGRLKYARNLAEVGHIV